MATLHSAEEIASFFIEKANSQFIERDTPEGVSNLKLQKILYFAQAAHLVLRGAPLFSEKIEAWQYGPVVPGVYRTYQEYANKPIPEPRVKPSNFDEDLVEFLNNTWFIFGKFTAGQLVSMTHEHKPWKDAWAREGSKNEISPEALKEYYTGLIVAN
jgi:uncharacterized phage-associated protein